MVRIASFHDLDFVTDCIIESEKSGTDILSWERILGISEFEVRSLIREIIAEEIDGQEWHLPNYRILEEGNVPIGALSTWIEGLNGSKSGNLKAQAIAWFKAQEWAQAEQRLKLVQQLNIERITGALQLENIYIIPQKRGLGLVSKLIEEVIDTEMEKEEALEFAEIQLMAENSNAYRSYTKCGFLKRLETTETSGEIINLLPGRSRVSLLRYLPDGKK